ncbi:MAG: polyprenol monophosphomannose synthase [Actinobacteria bacterium]|nr:polyprenol monophosphomannose synthase [Actinomycetota bacterium]
MREIVVVMPTYNERENLERMVAAVLAQPLDLSILVVDDNSPDGTGEIADRLAAGDERVEVLHRPGKSGLGTAYRAGFRHALQGGAQYLFEIDADFSHNPDDIPRLYAAAREADAAVGSRYVRGGGCENWSLYRWMISRGGNLYTKLVARTRTVDTTSGFRCYTRRVLEAIPLDRVTSQGYAFQIEMTFVAEALGFRIVEVPIIFTDRKGGESKMSADIFWEGLRVVWGLRRKYADLLRG